MVVDLEALFRDSASGRLKKAKHYQRLCATVPAAYGAHGDMALDAEEDWLWFRVGRTMAAANLPNDMTPAEAFGPRKMGAGPGGLAGIHLESGALKYVTSVPFQVGHVQTNPWVAGHKTSAADHPHPTFSPDGSRIQIQSAMLSEDGRSMDICIVPVPEEWLNR